MLLSKFYHSIQCQNSADIRAKWLNPTLNSFKPETTDGPINQSRYIFHKWYFKTDSIAKSPRTETVPLLPGRATASVYERLRVRGRVELHDPRDVGDVDAARHHIRAYQQSWRKPQNAEWANSLWILVRLNSNLAANTKWVLSYVHILEGKDAQAYIDTGYSDTPLIMTLWASPKSIISVRNPALATRSQWNFSLVRRVSL